MLQIIYRDCSFRNNTEILGSKHQYTFNTKFLSVNEEVPLVSCLPYRWFMEENGSLLHTTCSNYYISCVLSPFLFCVVETTVRKYYSIFL